jgi:2',3'-cyclic-nucleotide 2'-phosphodiesterase (5'-nucleotidase family)
MHTTSVKIFFLVAILLAVGNIPTSLAREKAAAFDESWFPLSIIHINDFHAR